MSKLRRLAWACTATLAVATVAVAAQPQPDDKNGREAESHAKVQLKASPMISMSPARVVFTAEIVGGADDNQEFYCPTVEWQWGDGTVSSSSADCDPYEAGKSSIKRRFTVDHVFRAGNWRVLFRLKQHDKSVASATASIQVRPGLRDIGGR
jgi:hypothetical protein